MTNKQTTEVVQTPEAMQPMPQQAYDPNVYYQQPVDPNKGKAKWLTFEYALAMSSTVLAAGLLVSVVVAICGLLFRDITVASTYVGGWVANILSIGMITPGTGIIAAAVLSLVLAIVAFVAFGRVSRTIAEREGYTGRVAYKAITYAAFAAVLVPSVVLVAKIGAILLSSLLFISVSNASDIYTSLYLAEFLPYALGLGIMGYTALCLKHIVSGKNASKSMTLALVVAAAIVLFAGTITVAVKSHSSTGYYNGDRSSTRSYDIYY